MRSISHWCCRHEMLCFHLGTRQLVGISFCWFILKSVFESAGEYGRLGHGEPVDCTAPRLVEDLERKGIRSLALGLYHTLALADNGDIYSWGSGTSHWDESEKLTSGSCDRREWTIGTWRQNQNGIEATNDRLSRRNGHSTSAPHVLFNSMALLGDVCAVDFVGLLWIPQLDVA